MRRRPVASALIAFLAAAALACGPVAVATPTAVSPTAAALLVAAPPWRSADALVAAAGGEVVAGPRFLRVVRGRVPDLAARLWREGAWIVVADRRLAALAARPGPGRRGGAAAGR